MIPLRANIGQTRVVTEITSRRIPTTESDDHLTMITSKGIAAAVVGLASLSLVGVALANEAEGPDLADQVEVVAGPCDTTTTTVVDEGTADSTEATAEDPEVEGTEVESTEVEGTEDDGCDEPAAVESDDDETEAVDEAVDDEDDTTVEDEAVDGEHPLNHGYYVSEATRTCPESGRERGECISSVAKSDLGKPGGEDATVGDDEAGSDTTVEEAPAPSTKASSGQGHAKGQTKAKGKGKP